MIKDDEANVWTPTICRADTCSAITHGGTFVTDSTNCWNVVCLMSSGLCSWAECFQAIFLLHLYKHQGGLTSDGSAVPRDAGVHFSSYIPQRDHLWYALTIMFHCLKKHSPQFHAKLGQLMYHKMHIFVKTTHHRFVWELQQHNEWWLQGDQWASGRYCCSFCKHMENQSQLSWHHNTIWASLQPGYQQGYK